ncbi:MAG: flagellar biosynthesis protein FlhF, partial [Wujia sp.]
MIIKKYKAQTEKEAILLAKEELGPDAIVMNVKTIKPNGLMRLFKKPRVELTAAIDDDVNEEAATTERHKTTQNNIKSDEKIDLKPEKQNEEKEHVLF